MHGTTQRLLVTVWLAGGLLVAVQAGETNLAIHHAWIRALPPSSEDTAAFLTIVNSGKEPCRLTGGSTPIAAKVMPMITTRKTVDGNEVLGMQGVKSLEIPAGGRLVLKPGGNHLMLMKLKQHPRAGGKVPLTLHIEPGHRRIKIEVPVALRMEDVDHE